MTKFNLDRDLIIIDVETTGVTYGVSGIIQLGAYKFFRDGTIDENYFDIYIKPYVDEWQPEAESIHGISKVFLEKNGVTLNRAIKEFFNWIGDNPNKYYIGQWACGFDKQLLEEAFLRENVKYPFTHRAYDISSVVRLFLAVNGICGKNLKNCAEILGIQLQDFKAHNASQDAYLSTLCLKKVMENGFVKKNPLTK